MKHNGSNGQMTPEQYQRYLMSIRSGTADPRMLAALGEKRTAQKPQGLIGQPMSVEEEMFHRLRHIAGKAAAGLEAEGASKEPMPEFARVFRGVGVNPFWLGESTDFFAAMSKGVSCDVPQVAQPHTEP